MEAARLYISICFHEQQHLYCSHFSFTFKSWAASLSQHSQLIQPKASGSTHNGLTLSHECPLTPGSSKAILDYFFKPEIYSFYQNLSNCDFREKIPQQVLRKIYLFLTHSECVHRALCRHRRWIDRLRSHTHTRSPHTSHCWKPEPWNWGRGEQSTDTYSPQVSAAVHHCPCCQQFCTQSSTKPTHTQSQFIKCMCAEGVLLASCLLVSLCTSFSTESTTGCWTAG